MSRQLVEWKQGWLNARERGQYKTRNKKVIEFMINEIT